MNNTNLEDGTLERLLSDLDVDLDYVNQLIKKNGWSTASRILGYDIIKYDNLQLAGRMAIDSVKRRIGNELDNYLIIMKPRLKEIIYQFIMSHQDQLQRMILSREKRDINYDWFSANSLVKTYLTKDGIDGSPCETPLQLWMRISVTLYHKYGLDAIKVVFDQLCDGYYIPASPTIFNAGMRTGQMSSCFLMTVDDSLDSIYDRLKDSAGTSKRMGANGIDMSRLRDSNIGLDGKSNGIMPWVKLFNESTRAVNQNGKRKGATTVYNRPHHTNIFEFCEGPLKSGDQYMRAHDVNYALWMPWLFWKRYKNDGDWTLFCPNKTRELNDIWGIEWMERYEAYEKDLSVPKKVVKARKLLDHIMDIQRKTGMPYMLNCDAINMKCNQKNLGYIRCSNLCLEITEFTSDDEIASCNLSSISLRMFVKSKYKYNENKFGDLSFSPIIMAQELRKCYDFDKLGEITRRVVVNLNRVIEENSYYNDQIKRSNDRNRPIGIGVSGFADALHELDIPFQDPDKQDMPYPPTKELNKMIFACMYWNALASSVDQAIKYGKYESYEGSPISKGKFQFDLWKDEYTVLKMHGMIDDRFRKEEDDDEISPTEWDQYEYTLSNGYIIGPSWTDLRCAIKKYGIRNSLLIALMPTATSSQPLRNAETVEAHQSNIYSRKIMNGAYPVINRYMVKDLEELGLWSRETIDLIQSDGGSIKNIKKFAEAYPDKYPDYKPSDRLEWVIQKYKTMWELSMFIFMDMAADRGRYVCQSQSLNIYLEDPSDEQLIAVHMYGNDIGLKTGMYYLREKAARDPIKITVDPDIINFIPSTISIDYEEEKKEITSSIICNDEICIACQ